MSQCFSYSLCSAPRCVSHRRAGYTCRAHAACLLMLVYTHAWLRTAPVVESQTHNRKVASSSLGPAGIVGGGVNVQRSLHLQYHDEVPFEQGTEPPTAPRALQHKWLPTAPGVCVFIAVCVCTWIGKCRARIQRKGHHTWLYAIFTFSLSLYKHMWQYG